MRKSLAIVSLACVSLSSIGTQAQEQDVMQFAQESARVAGGARFCKLDDEKIEAFITRSYAAISRLSRDETEKAIARIEFKNHLNVASVQQPEEGCRSFADRFDRINQK